MVLSKPKNKKIIDCLGKEFFDKFTNELDTYAKEKSDFTSVIFKKGIKKIIRFFLLKRKDLKFDYDMIEKYAINYFSFKMCEEMINKMESIK